MSTPTLSFVDSHTGGEPTRVILSGWPDLRGSTVEQKAQCFAKRFDDLRSAAVNEPRGSDILVGALLLPPSKPTAACGVIFFNNVGVLGMCGHGTIGLAVTLHHLGKLAPGTHIIETAVGDVTVVLHDAHHVSVTNVPSYRFAKQVPVQVPGIGKVHGDIAWGGNWFFLVNDHGQELLLKNAAELTHVASDIRKALDVAQVKGDTSLNRGIIDHIELFGPAQHHENHSRNFVLCPGLAYDRSPCGTGTSAKVACLAADGKLLPGQVWRQESITGSVFEASYDRAGETIRPTITGSAFVTARGELILNPADPLRHGFSTVQ
jgi:4-hydroxyproline epimerase